MYNILVLASPQLPMHMYICMLLHCSGLYSHIYTNKYINMGDFSFDHTNFQFWRVLYSWGNSKLNLVLLLDKFIHDMHIHVGLRSAHQCFVSSPFIQHVYAIWIKSLGVSNFGSMICVSCVGLICNPKLISICHVSVWFGFQAYAYVSCIGLVCNPST